MLRSPPTFSGGLLWIAALVAIGHGQDHADLPDPQSATPQLYATGFEYAGGLALDAAGNLYVVDYRGKGNIGRITSDGTASVLCTLGELVPVEQRQSRANSLRIDSEGRLIAADSGAGRLLRLAADGSEGAVLADRWQRVRFHSVNHVALDSAGNIYFTDLGDSRQEKSNGALFRYDINTTEVTRLEAGLAQPTGIAVTPDQTQLCVAEGSNRRILAFGLNEDGSLGGKRVLIQFPDPAEAATVSDRSRPQGMVFDANSRLFVAMSAGGVVDVVDFATGRIVREYNAGGAQTTDCHFHGTFLYTTVAAKEAVFRLRLGVRGFAYAGP
jgi:sugar lactone lactonase YvrE